MESAESEREMLMMTMIIIIIIIIIMTRIENLYEWKAIKQIKNKTKMQTRFG